MPAYELALILRALKTEALAKEIVPIVQRVQALGGIVKDVKNLGAQNLPYRMKSHFEYHNTGTYSFLTFESSSSAISDLDLTLKRNTSIIRHNFVKLSNPGSKPMACRFKGKSQKTSS
eukprot:gene8770-7774_t